MNNIAVAAKNIGSKPAKTESSSRISGYERSWDALDGSNERTVDTHHENGSQFHFVTIRPSKESMTVDFPDYGSILQVTENEIFGSILKTVSNGIDLTIWLPWIAHEILFDDHQRISYSPSPSCSFRWEFTPSFRLKVDNLCTDRSLTTPYVAFKDPDGNIFREFNTCCEVERRLFRKSEWFHAVSPSDIWNYLIAGSIYDPRADKTIKKRFKCQQCAFSWWNYFELLKRETGKKIYTILQDEIAFSVLKDLSPEGRWGHGFWSDAIETHARFHLDGIHLLISQYEKTADSVWLQAAERAMNFILNNLVDSFSEDQIWFLHDTIELEQNHRFKTTLFGKSPGNSLCINTHVQALTVLNRLRSKLQEKKQFTSAYNKGCNALRRVLEYRPAELPYKVFSFWITKSKTLKNSKSIAEKIMRKVVNRLLGTIYWPFQQRFPRLVHPSGFIERDLSLSRVSDRYMITNIKDLLTLYQQDPLTWLGPYVRNGTAYLREFISASGLSGLLKQSPYFIEFIDILFLYDKLVGPVPAEEMKRAADTILEVTGGYSIDLCASPLVRQDFKGIDIPGSGLQARAQ